MARKMTALERLGNLTLKQIGIALGIFLFGFVFLVALKQAIQDSTKEDLAAKEAAQEDAARKAEADEKWLNTDAGRLCVEHPLWTHKVCDAIVAKQIYIGMTAEQVKASWHEPYKINKTTYPNHTTEQWVMYEGEDEYLYFEDGILRTIQQPTK